MKINNALPKLLVVLLAIVLMASCEEEIGTIGSEVIGDQDVNATLDITSTIRSYSKEVSGCSNQWFADKPTRDLQ